METSILDTPRSFSASTNLDFTYDYTQWLVKTRLENLDKLNARLSAFLAFGGVVLRFTFDIPGRIPLEGVPPLMCYSCLMLKALVFGLTVASIWVGAVELKSGIIKTTVDPKDLMDDTWFDAEPGRGKALVTNTWIATLDTLDRQVLKKGQVLNSAILLLLLAVTALAIDVLIASAFA